MPRKIPLKRSDAIRIEEIRTWLGRAAHETRKLSHEARETAKRRNISHEKGKEHGRRFRMARVLAEQMELVRELMWELSGVKWD